MKRARRPPPAPPAAQAPPPQPLEIGRGGGPFGSSGATDDETEVPTGAASRDVNAAIVDTRAEVTRLITVLRDDSTSPAMRLMAESLLKAYARSGDEAARESLR